tara:strand:+ start:142 stop:720 length:579 start_codon:yes stop_codon:yes gene_type:complete
MLLDIKKFGIEQDDFHLDMDKVSSVLGPFFVESTDHTALGWSELFIEKDIYGYLPPNYQFMMGQVIVNIPHYYIDVTCGGKDYKFRYSNIGWKKKGGFYKAKLVGEIGEMDPRINELKEHLLSHMNRNNLDSTESNSFDGKKDINEDTYQLYLVEKYDIRKNDTLNKFVLNGKPYAELIEVLKVANELESSD